MRFFILLLSMVMTGSPALATTIRVPEDAATIQAAIDQAGMGDHIQVGAGTWREQLTLNGRGLTLEATQGAARTTLDGTGLAGAVLTVHDDAAGRTVIRGFTITGGTGIASHYNPSVTVGGGLVIRKSSPLIEKCRFVGNTVVGEGGGVWSVGGSQPRFVSCEFTANKSERGSGVYLRNSSAVFMSCTFRENLAIFGGGGLFADFGSSVVLTDCQFRECRAEFNGGGAYIYDTIVQFNECEFIQNSAGFAGGAVYQGFRGKAVFESCIFKTQLDSVAGGASAAIRPPKGACRVAGQCIETIEKSCRDAGGLWSGPMTDCVQVLAAMAPTPRPGDLNDDDRVDIRDVGILMSLWGGGRPSVEQTKAP